VGLSRFAGVSGASSRTPLRARVISAGRSASWSIIAVAASIGVAIAWVPARQDNSNVDVALALLVVIAAAGASGRRAAVACAAVSAATGFTFFDTAPFDHFTITKSPDVVTAVLLVVVGAATGELAVRVARQRRQERSSPGDMGRVRRVSASLAAGDELVMMIGSVADELKRLLDLQDCWFTAEPVDAGALCVSRDGRLCRGTTNGSSVRPLFRGARDVVLPVWGQGLVVGHFILQARPGRWADQEQLLVAVTLADQVGAALFVQAPPMGTSAQPPPPGEGPRPGLHVVR
jgi:hypothetical protein